MSPRWWFNVMGGLSQLEKVSPLLRRHLAKILDRYISRRDAIEVCINRPGEVWIETETGWEKKVDPAITVQACNDFLSVLATQRGQLFSDTTPFLATTIPGYNFRIQAVGGSVAADGIAISIRCGRAQRFPIPDYHKPPEQPIATITGAAENIDEADRLIELVRRGGNILVAGPTGSGKTTYLNSLLALVPLDLRLGLVEDSQELVVDHPNHFRLLKSKTGTDLAKVTYEQIVDALMRMTPAGILFSEIDVRNTVPFLLLMNTGHKYCFSTIHANEGASQAVKRMVLNAQLGGLAGGAELVREYATQELDAVVFVHRTRTADGRRHYRATVDYL